LVLEKAAAQRAFEEQFCKPQEYLPTKLPKHLQEQYSEAGRSLVCLRSIGIEHAADACRRERPGSRII